MVFAQSLPIAGVPKLVDVAAMRFDVIDDRGLIGAAALTTLMPALREERRANFSPLVTVATLSGRSALSIAKRSRVRGRVVNGRGCGHGVGWDSVPTLLELGTWSGQSPNLRIRHWQ